MHFTYTIVSLQYLHCKVDYHFQISWDHFTMVFIKSNIIVTATVYQNGTSHDSV